MMWLKFFGGHRSGENASVNFSMLSDTKNNRSVAIYIEILSLVFPFYIFY